MDPLVWLAAYLLGFTVLQLLLYRYFRREVPRGETTTPASADGGTPRAATGTDAPDTDGSRCPHCGAENEAEGVYSYCRECLSPLE